MFGNSGQHARTYFLIVMEGKDNVIPARS